MNGEEPAEDNTMQVPITGSHSRRIRSQGRLYFSHLLTQFGDRLWQFAIPILFISVWRNSLLPSAIFNFLLYIVKLLFLPVVGRCVDTLDRLRLITWGTFGQSLCISLSALILAIVALRVDESKADFGEDALDNIMFVFLILIGVVGDLFDTALKLGVEKDWVVVIVDEQVDRGEIPQEMRKDKLARLNSQLRAIDLLCKICAPLFFGLAIGLQTSPKGEVMLGAGIVIAWSLFACLPVYWSWRSVYLEFVSLQRVKPEKESNPFSVLVQGGLAYTKHTVFLASLAYCCLYFTVLSDHHPLSTAFLKMDGVSSFVLGAARAGGAFTGMLGTFMYPHLRAKLGVVRTNVVAAWAFVCCIVPISLLYLDNEPWSARAYLLLLAIVCSRAFLWCFDLANVQTMQEAVEEDCRGEINAMQAATCNVMELLMATIALFCTAHSQFRILVFASGGGVTLAAILITLWHSTRESAVIQHIEPS